MARGRQVGSRTVPGDVSGIGGQPIAMGTMTTRQRAWLVWRSPPRQRRCRATFAAGSDEEDADRFDVAVPAFGNGPFAGESRPGRPDRIRRVRLAQAAPSLAVRPAHLDDLDTAFAQEHSSDPELLPTPQAFS